MAPAERRRGVRPMLDDRRLELAAAGQWEWLLSWLGEAPAEGGLPKAEQWRLILPQLGFMAALRNLRNLDQAGLSDEDVASLLARFSDPRAGEALPPAAVPVPVRVLERAVAEVGARPGDGA